MSEFIYSLLILSGMIKFFLMFTAGSLAVVDFTLLTSSILTLFLLADVFKGWFLKSKFNAVKESLPPVLILMAFYGWMVLSLLYSESPEYSYTKAFLFPTSILAFIFPLFYRRFDPQRFFKYLVFFGTGFLLLYVAAMPESYYDYSETEKQFLDKYLDVGYLSALNILVLSFIKMEIKPLWRIGFLGVNAAIVVIAGARGPLLIMLVVLLIKALINTPKWLTFLNRLSFKKIVVVLLGVMILAAGLVGAVYNYGDSIDRTMYRLSLTLDAGSSSVGARLNYIGFSFEKIFESVKRVLIGYGIGSFGKMYDNEDRRLYPHNILLETWFELGIVGVVLISILFFLYVRRIHSGGVFYVFLFLLLNSLKSSSLVDLRIVFGIMAVLWVIKMKELSQSNPAQHPLPEPDPK